MKKYLFFVLSMIIFIISGCNDQKGNQFIGEWKQKTDEKFPSTLSIKKKDGVFYIDDRYFDVKVAEKKYEKELIEYMRGVRSGEMPSQENSYSDDSYRVKKLEAVSVNDDLLKGDGYSLRLEKDILYFNGDAYIKLKG
ncbi:hypothetical protein JRK10_004905 [Salmonella enterica]|nr:hypothetical protein [Salmonella enterica]OIN18652.1 hypothetical protein AO411_2019725 [Salmonella enterica subsp. enterica serovar Sarajane]